MSRVFGLLSVFVKGPGGGNAVLVASEGDDLADQQMQALAQESGLESAFTAAGWVIWPSWLATAVTALCTTVIGDEQLCWRTTTRAAR